ncbi:MAG: ATP-binding cassette domain-containing protein [Methanospirillum sp.]|nr:ATP-binding cassette domain-containing protein [Methanospirillum sp.]
MRVVLNDLILYREHWSLSARGSFTDGIHLISGDTGSGKTTLALLIAGLMQPSQGSAEREQVESLMVSFQFPEYHVTGATVREECSSWGGDPLTILMAVNLAGKEDLSPLRLSRGELKRLHLACLLANDYDLLILDEPFSSLDCLEKERICGEISSRQKGITIIFTHEQELFPRVDYIWEIERGSLCCRGPLPGALMVWDHAPVSVKKLVAQGKIPDNITPKDLLEVACRT